jgi:hypothetical protein
MNCAVAREKLAETAADRPRPLGLLFHLWRCPVCAAEARRLEGAIAVLRAARRAAAPDFSAAVMGALRREPALGQATVSLRDWMLVGALILLAAAALPFGDAFVWLRASLGPELLLPLSLTFGLGLTVYCLVFILSHLDEFEVRFKLRRRA